MKRTPCSTLETDELPNCRENRPNHRIAAQIRVRNAVIPTGPIYTPPTYRLCRNPISITLFGQIQQTDVNILPAARPYAVNSQDVFARSKHLFRLIFQSEQRICKLVLRPFGYQLSIQIYMRLLFKIVIYNEVQIRYIFFGQGKCLPKPNPAAGPFCSDNRAYGLRITEACGTYRPRAVIKIKSSPAFRRFIGSVAPLLRLLL